MTHTLSPYETGYLYGFSQAVKAVLEHLASLANPTDADPHLAIDTVTQENEPSALRTACLAGLTKAHGLIRASAAAQPQASDSTFCAGAEDSLWDVRASIEGLYAAHNAIAHTCPGHSAPSAPFGTLFLLSATLWFHTASVRAHERMHAKAHNRFHPVPGRS